MSDWTKVMGLSCLVLACLWVTAHGRKLHLGSCAVNIHTHELRHHFKHIRPGMISADKYKSVRLLRKDEISSLKVSESCCFLSQVLNFYLDEVFSSYTSSHSLHRRTTSVLSNSFFSIAKDLQVCRANAHCECSEATRLKLAEIKNTYAKLDRTAGTVKAIGELDSLIEWIESFYHS